MRCITSLLASILLFAVIAPGVAAQDAPPAEERRGVQIQLDLADLLEQARDSFREGKLEEAIAIYQVIISLAPDFRVARVELSLALVAFGERERAARLLRDLDTDGLDPEIVDIIGRIIGPDRLTFFFVPEFFLDSNVTGQTQDEVIIINGLPFRLSDQARGQRGYGYGLTFGAGYRLTDEFPRTTLTGGITMRDFESSKDDEVSPFASVSFGFDFLDRRFAMTPSLSAVYRYKNWEPLEFEWGAGLAGTLNLPPVRNTLGFRYRQIGDERDDSSVRDRRSYEIYDTFAFGFDEVVLRFDERFIREDWDVTDSQDNNEVISTIDLTFTGLPWTVPTVGGSFTYRDFRNPAPFFNVERLDQRWEGHIEFLFRDWEVFDSPVFLRYEYSDQSSNIELFDFDKHEISLGVRAIVF